VRASTLSALATALGVSVDYLLGGAAAVATGLLKHRLATYGTDDEYVASAVPFITEGLARADCVLAVTAKLHAGLLHDALGDRAQDVEFLDASTWYRSLGNAASGYRTLVNERFERGAPWVRIIGEPAWHGQSDAELAAWFRYEALVNLAFASSPATVVCTYDTRRLPERAIENARRTHPEVTIAGAVTASPAYREPEDFLLNLS
jgi:hypothetical protein